jgi:uncharacterized protein
MHKIGIISDTHGLLRPEVLQAFQGVDHILHAGDIGKPAVMETLRKIAPVTAVRGNVDTADWCRDFPQNAVVEIGGLYFYVLHDLQTLDLDPVAAGFSAIIFGHSHETQQITQNGVLYFNPGSAGPRRLLLPVTVGLITIESTRIRSEIIPILG